LRRHNYRIALPELMRDFSGRCAYSMQHNSRCGILEVDHFDPRKKKDVKQQYENLFPASRYCNGKKSDVWPTSFEGSAGCRFLNPCKETEYGECIFEDQTTHQLIGITPAARWHIRVCGLNADHLINERRRRSQHWELLRRTAVRIHGDQAIAAELALKYREEVELMIPEILPPPPA
jgi:hypothetical protein